MHTHAYVTHVCLMCCVNWCVGLGTGLNWFYFLFQVQVAKTEKVVRAYVHVCMYVCMYRLHTKGEVAKSLGNQARGVQPDDYTKFKNQVDK